jgi:hypothetical protein
MIEQASGFLPISMGSIPIARSNLRPRLANASQYRAAPERGPRQFHSLVSTWFGEVDTHVGRSGPPETRRQRGESPTVRLATRSGSRRDSDPRHASAGANA